MSFQPQHQPLVDLSLQRTGQSNLRTLRGLLIMMDQSMVQIFTITGEYRSFSFAGSPVEPIDEYVRDIRFYDFTSKQRLQFVEHLNEIDSLVDDLALLVDQRMQLFKDTTTVQVDHDLLIKRIKDRLK